MYLSFLPFWGYFNAVLTWKELDENLEREEEDEFNQKVQEEFGGFEPASCDWQATALALRPHPLIGHHRQIKQSDRDEGRSGRSRKGAERRKHFFARYVSKVILLPMYISKVQKTRLLIYWQWHRLLAASMFVASTCYQMCYTLTWICFFIALLLLYSPI